MVKTAIVMGGSRGLGRSIARRLAEDRFAIVVHFSTHTHDANETVIEIKELGGQAIAVQADITQEADVKRLFEAALMEFGRIDVVVNNVGILAQSPIARGDAETFDQIIRTNLRATFLVFAQAASHIADGGRIIAFTSNLVGISSPFYGAYVASKAGVEGLARVLANELRKREVSVNLVAFGPIATEHLLQRTSLVASEAMGETNDAVHVVSYLAGPEAGWISGQVIPAVEGPGGRASIVRPGAGPVTLPADLLVADASPFRAY